MLASVACLCLLDPLLLIRASSPLCGGLRLHLPPGPRLHPRPLAFSSPTLRGLLQRTPTHSLPPPLALQDSRGQSTFLLEQLQQQAADLGQAAAAMPMRVQKIESTMALLETGDLKLRVGGWGGVGGRGGGGGGGAGAAALSCGWGAWAGSSRGARQGSAASGQGRCPQEKI